MSQHPENGLRYPEVRGLSTRGVMRQLDHRCGIDDRGIPNVYLEIAMRETPGPL